MTYVEHVGLKGEERGFGGQLLPQPCRCRQMACDTCGDQTCPVLVSVIVV
jgi:hypothetical protein